MQRSLARRLWQTLPQKTRLQIFSTVSRLGAPRPDRNAVGGLPIAIAGLFSTASGIGEAARLEYAALEAGGLSPAGFDLSAAFGQADLGHAPALRALEGGNGTLIVHHNAQYVPHALRALGRARIRSRRIIGYWAWELPKLPPDWASGFQYVHEIWVPSTFTRDAIAAATDLPVHVLPHPLPELKTSNKTRADFGLPTDAVVVLNVFHLGSAFVRKNPLAAITAFRRAFADRSDRVLVIKVAGNDAISQQALDDAIAGVSNIKIIDGTLSAEDMTALMQAADIVISLHRSEGFGLVPAQAMQLGKAVIATGWSGNLEFMREGNAALVRHRLVPVEDPRGPFAADGQQWAEPDIAHAAEWLTQLSDNPELRSRLGETARADVAAQLSPARFAALVRERLQNRA
jgi:glycosyltransferase involved in cell wall biosynthesis